MEIYRLHVCTLWVCEDVFLHLCGTRFLIHLYCSCCARQDGVVEKYYSFHGKIECYRIRLSGLHFGILHETVATKISQLDGFL